jgi:hypothetical protein
MEILKWSLYFYFTAGAFSGNRFVEFFSVAVALFVILDFNAKLSIYQRSNDQKSSLNRH